MANISPILKLEQYLMTKENFLHETMVCSFGLHPDGKIDKDFEIVKKALLSVESKGTLSQTAINRLKHFIATKIFFQKILRLEEEIETSIYNKIDVLVESALKIEYLSNALNKLYEICLNAQSILASYSLSENISDPKYISVMERLRFSWGADKKILIAEDFIELAVESAENFVKNLPKGDEIIEFFEKANDDYIIGCLCSALESIHELSVRLINNHREILGETKIQTNGLYITGLIEKDSSVIIEQKPKVSEKYLSDVFNKLKIYFEKSDHSTLKKILKNGENAATILTYNGTGMSLADAFKRLYEKKVIAGCQKKQLEKWIMINFRYNFKGKVMKFTPKYLEDIISSSVSKCMKPILEVNRSKNGDVEIVSL